MLTRTLPVSTLVLVAVLFSATLLGQQKPAASAPPGAQEFPVVMEQNVAAGKTPVGARIKAKLEVATLIDGKVIPRSAVFSGEVIDSAAKTATDPSRLAIRIDSVVWKKGSASITAYLTAWYYPMRDAAGQDLQYGPTQSPKGSWNGQGQYPDSNSKVYKPFPGSDSGNDASAPNTPSATTSNRRVLMKDVESAKNNDGVIAIVSRNSNIKLDKLTTYVLATGDLLPAK
jgi:hypothetical protein